MSNPIHIHVIWLPSLKWYVYQLLVSFKFRIGRNTLLIRALYWPILENASGVWDGCSQYGNEKNEKVMMSQNICQKLFIKGIECAKIITWSNIEKFIISDCRVELLFKKCISFLVQLMGGILLVQRQIENTQKNFLKLVL